MLRVSLPPPLLSAGSSAAALTPRALPRTSADEHMSISGDVHPAMLDASMLDVCNLHADEYRLFAGDTSMRGTLSS